MIRKISLPKSSTAASPVTKLIRMKQRFHLRISIRRHPSSLVIPKGAYTDLTDFAARASDAEIADWVRALARVAASKGVDGPGYRVIMNCGGHAHQEVPHLHGHVLGGRALGPMLTRND